MFAGKPSAMESNLSVALCSWGRESGRKPRTEAHFEAMRKRADALEEYVNLLESVLEKCRREHGGVQDNGQSYLQFRPRDAEGMIMPDEVDGDDNDEPKEEDHSFSQELCLPTMNLQLEDGSLIHHGNTAIFRFAPEQPIILHTSRFTQNSQLPQYTLLVENYDKEAYNPDFDWSRYLPASVPLDRKEHDRLLDLLFKFFMSWCIRLVSDLFLRDMCRMLRTPRSQTPPKTAHYSPMLHNSLLAVATAFSDDPRIRDIKTRQAFAILAKSYVEAECQQPNISVVHALSCLGSYHSGLGEQTLGYLYFGMSARMSQALGLSIDCSAWVRSGLITENDMFDRNWAFWAIFAQDVCWSLYVGRDFSIPSTDSKRIPIPFVDTEFDSLPWCYPPSGVAPQANHLSKTFAASCKLMMIARRIMDVVNGLNNASVRHEVNIELISSIDLQLNTWKSNLTPDLDITLKSRPTATPHRLMMHCIYWWFFILLHRPFYHRKNRPSDRDIDHIKLCKRAAENIVELLGTWRSLYTLRYAPITLVQTAFSAGTIYLLGAVQAATGLRVAQESLKHALAQAQLCVEYLLEIGRSWQCATNIAEILKRLLQEQLKPLLARRSIQADGVPVNSPAQDHGHSISPGPSFDHRTRRRRSPSTRRSTSVKEENSIRGRPPIPFQSFAQPGSSNPRSPLSSAHRSPLPSTESQPQSPSFSISRSNSNTGIPFNQPQSTWGLDYASTSQIDDAMSMAYQRFGEADGTGSRAGQGMVIDFNSLGRGTFDAAASARMDVDGNNASIPGATGHGSQGLDPSSFLAMLGGEPLSDAPFLPTFDSYSPPGGEGGTYSPNIPQQSTPSFEAAVQGGVIPEPDLAILSQFWDQNFSS
ncbi:hypothetical protein H0H92_005904 [Tricholoma furcatifolium]|nr:hypothetical protein H0H92_005904 [Tricholoma furcatifolium]